MVTNLATDVTKSLQGRSIFFLCYATCFILDGVWFWCQHWEMIFHLFNKFLSGSFNISRFSGISYNVLKLGYVTGLAHFVYLRRCLLFKSQYSVDSLVSFWYDVTWSDFLWLPQHFLKYVWQLHNELKILHRSSGSFLFAGNCTKNTVRKG